MMQSLEERLKTKFESVETQKMFLYENMNGIFQSLTTLEKWIVFELFHGPANTRVLHFSVIDRLFEEKKKDLKEEEFKELEDLKAKSFTNFYKQYNKVRKLPSYFTIRKKLEELSALNIVIKRTPMANKKTKEVWALSPVFFEALSKKKFDVGKRVVEAKDFINPYELNIFDSGEASAFLKDLNDMNVNRMERNLSNEKVHDILVKKREIEKVIYVAKSKIDDNKRLIKKLQRQKKK